jgi:predicted Ser/Thr protein kinase
MDAPKPTGLAPAQPFTRTDLEHGSPRLLARGRWANAVVNLFDHGGTTWVVKDFRERSFAVRNLIGRLLVRREARWLARVDGLPYMPQGAFRIDAYALAYRYVPGRSLRGKPPYVPGPEYFPALERALATLHEQAGLAHFDLRNAKNLLVTDAGEPLVLDFQSAFGTGWMPGRLRRFAEQVDFAAIYKHWKKRSPETLGAERLAALGYMNRLRPLWVARGYIGAPGSGKPKN